MEKVKKQRLITTVKDSITGLRYIKPKHYCSLRCTGRRLQQKPRPRVRSDRPGAYLSSPLILFVSLSLALADHFLPVVRLDLAGDAAAAQRAR